MLRAGCLEQDAHELVMRSHLEDPALHAVIPAWRVSMHLPVQLQQVPRGCGEGVVRHKLVLATVQQEDVLCCHILQAG